MPTSFDAIYGAASPSGAAADTAAALESVMNPDWPGLPPNASPDHRDATITTATTTTVWAPGPDESVVIVAAFLSTDTAGRIAIVADTDTAGNRIAVLYAAANGGASPNLVPAPFVAPKGAPIRVVTAAAGNTFVRLTGYIVTD